MRLPWVGCLLVGCYLVTLTPGALATQRGNVLLVFDYTYDGPGIAKAGSGELDSVSASG